MYGLYDIKQMNARKVAAHIKADDELALATEHVKMLRNDASSVLLDGATANTIADLLVSAYGIEED